MKFLTVIMLITYYRNWMGDNPLREVFPTGTWFSWVSSRFSGENLRFILSVVLPSLAVLFVSIELEGLFLGLFWLILSMAIVLYAIDIVDTDIIFDDQMLWLRGLEGSEDVSQLQQTQVNFCRDIIYDVFQSAIPVLFWFLMLGPAGSLFFVLSQQYLEGRDDENAGPDFLVTILYWLEWIPARLNCLLFALLGDFGRTYPVLAESVFDIESPNEHTLYESARCAVQAGNGSAGEEPEQSLSKFVESAGTELQDLRLLLERSLWGWVGFAALLTILGL